VDEQQELYGLQAKKEIGILQVRKKQVFLLRLHAKI
jgi:hypothetical protein